ncbi:Mitochondrial carrier domain-containing protein [Rhodotorula toruloides]|nr:Mitochondrial carrier domain-containing protein [Rhodotorula toruloides]
MPPHLPSSLSHSMSSSPPGSPSSPSSLDAAEPAPISPALDFFAGTVAGIASLVTGHPFDTVKVRLQTQPRTSSRSSTYTLAQTAASTKDGLYYRNAGHAFVRVVREEGVRGLYKGVLGVALMNASVFTSYKYAMNLLSPGDGQKEPGLGEVAVAGAASGVFTSIITTPIDRLKILQQSVLPSSSSSAATPARQPSLLSLLRTLSLPSLYRGWSATILRDLGYGPYFLTYEYVVRGGSFGLSWAEGEKRHLKRDLREEVESEVFGIGEGGEEGAASPGRVLLAGGLAGIVGWGCTFPLDVVKTKIQSVPASSLLPSSTSTSSSPEKYSTILSTIRTSYHEAGWRVFIAGLGPTLVRSVPVNMVTFAVFELVVAAFR